MSYKIYKGYIKDYDSLKTEDGITSYSIEMASSSGTNLKNRNFYNIVHGFSSEPENTDELFKKGTLVYFIVDDATGDGVTIAAADKNPGRNIRTLTSDEQITTIFEKGGTSIPITSGDWIRRKLDGFIGIFYSGLVRLRAKLGTEFILNPVLEMAELMCNRFKISIGNFGLVEFGWSKQDGKTNINLVNISDTTGFDIGSTVTHVKIGQHDDETRKATISITKNVDETDPELVDFGLYVDGKIILNLRKDKLQLEIDKDGNIQLKAKSLNFNINDQSSVEIKEDGKAYVKTEEFFLGKGDTTQPLIRGTELKTNYNNLLDLLKNHIHPVVSSGSGLIAERSLSLVVLSEKQLTENRELSTTNFLD